MKPRIIHGAPPMIRVPAQTQTTRITRYQPGVTPGSLSIHPKPGVLGPSVIQPAPTRASPAAGPRPHPDLMTKADEAQYAESTVGNKLGGTLGR